MSLAALGLPAHADQRAVKQAYARRLKAMRAPEEDPAAFQHLHELYKTALAEVACRAQDAAETEAAPLQPQDDGPPPEIDAAGADTTGFNPSGPRLVETEPPAPDADRETPPRPYEPALPLPPAPPRDDAATSIAQHTDEGFVIDANLLFQQMTENGATLDEASFRRWLARTTGDWPIAAKPKVAPHVLRYLAEDTPVIDPNNLAAIIETFALDDIQTVGDPLALEQARKTIAPLWSDRRSLEAAERLLRPENRSAMVEDIKARARLPRLVIRRIVEMLTGPNPTRWAALSRVVPLVAWAVMRVVLTLSHGRPDLLPRQIDPTVVARWRRVADFRNAIKPLTYSLAVIAILVGVVAGLSFVPTVTSDPGTRLNELVRQPYEASLPGFDAIIKENPPPWSSYVEEIVALAYLNKAARLYFIGRLAESREVGERLDAIFSNSTNPPVRLAVAKGLVNLAFVRGDQGDKAAAIEIDAQVIRRYGFTNDPQFDLQVAKALNYRTECYRDLGLFAEAREARDELHRRFDNATDPDVKDAVANAPSLGGFDFKLLR